MTESTPLADRYGRRRSPVFAISAAAVVLLGSFGVWVAWVMDTDPTSGLDWLTYGGTFSGNSARIDFTVTAPPGTPVSCAVRTLSEQMATNGWIIRDFPASATHSTDYSVTINAVSLAANGDVYRCWKTDS